MPCIPTPCVCRVGLHPAWFCSAVKQSGVQARAQPKPGQDNVLWARLGLDAAMPTCLIIAPSTSTGRLHLQIYLVSMHC